MTNMTHWKRNAGLFIGGQLISMFGSMLVQFAITWHITLETQSGVWMTLFTCAALLPMVIISPFAGVWADRYNRKYLINISDGAIAVTTLILAVVFFVSGENMLLMLVVVVIRGFGQGVQSPAVNALIPQIVPQEHLTRFNGIQSAVQSLTMFATPMLAGVLLTFIPIEYIFFIDVITAAIGISIVLFFVHVPRLERVQTGNGLGAYFGELKEGLRYIGDCAWLKILLCYTAFFCVLMTPAAMLTPLQVARSFGGDVWRLTAIEILFSLGMVMGGLAISVWGGFRNKVHTMIMACFAFGVTTILFGVVPNFWVYLSIMLLCGVTVPFFNTASMTIMQTKIEPQIMGRVFSILMMINSLAMPLGMALFGPLGDLVKIEYLLVVTGALLFASGFVLCASKTLKSVGEPTLEPEELP
ncbi:MAG: MFS transporter [Clostridiales Family XIII bacterium]|jgi:DHA3 family macrolide efflux protein-like MFS transporter|nr:MFS transporter [Clostridiales Family XIII bacterium]